MNSKKHVRSIGLVLALTVAVGLASIASASTPAQYEHGSQNEHGRWSKSHMTRFAYALGYNRGFEDASQSSYHTYRDVQRWREGTEGWEDPMGTRNSFRDNFKRGFQSGFMDARHHRHPRYTQSDVDRIRAEVNERRRDR